VESEIRVEIAQSVTPAMVDGISRLLPQLSATAAPITSQEIAAVVGSPSTHLFVAYDNSRIVGMLTLVVVRIPTGVRGHIEDVVVENAYRGRGIGKALTEAAISFARGQSIRTLDLTSRPSRVEAIQLYERLGFARRDTNVLRLKIAEPDLSL
jgi:ribosomal protein S18 acetylase RimI-like enzyme